MNKVLPVINNNMSDNAVFKEIDQLQREINSRRPLSLYQLGQIKEYFRIGLTYSSNALEGNSLTESETKVVLEEGIAIGGKRLTEHLEAIGHSDAYNFLYTCIKSNTIIEADIQQLHWLFYYRINEEQAGVYRSVNAYITGSKYPLPSADQLAVLMENLILQLNEVKSSVYPIIFAALMHKEFVFIYPFIDGNGRVARLLMNLALLQAGYTIAIIPPIMRSTYIGALEKAHENDHDFIMFIAHMVKETQKDYLRLF